MINLIPTDLKSSYIYAKRNVILKKWVTLFVFALIGLAALGTYGMVSIQQSSVRYEKEIANTKETFKKEKFAETQKEVKDISDNFKLVVKVLGQEVLFSQLLKQIASIIPANANLTGLNISQTSGGIDISASAIDYRTATQVQVNLADPANKIFSKADIVSITCNSNNDTKSVYPCTVNIRALFANENPFLFISNKAAKP
jgi:Tfp pilus assembly protein PilN